MTAPLSSQIETAHDDMIHDAQLDYYGKRLATCSSDRTVKVFDVVDGQAQTGAKGVTLKGHSGPVWQVAWAHPKYGHIIASCSYDGKVFIWKEDVQSSQGGARGAAPAVGWTKVKEHSLHTASVNSVSWAPHELGAIVACASSDGKISVLTFRNDNTWHADIFTAHSIGANAVSWMPAVVPGSLIAPPPPPTQSQSQSQPGPGAGYGLVRRFASAGCDNLVKVWGYNEQSSTYNLLHTLTHHSDWVRDVAFAPNIGLPRTYLASCGQDRQVVVWTCDGIGASGTESEGRESWGKCVLDGGADGSKFPDTVWRVSWSLSGNILAVSCGDGKVTLWKESITGDVGKDGGKWECVSEMSS